MPSALCPPPLPHLPLGIWDGVIEERLKLSWKLAANCKTGTGYTGSNIVSHWVPSPINDRQPLTVNM